MNDIKTCCIDSRKNALFASYDIKDPGNLKTIEDFFNKVEEFAKDCKDIADFEAKFATSPLSQEYMNLFTQMSQTECTAEGVAPSNEVEEEYTLADEMRDDAERAVRRRARQDVEDAARRTPIIGDAMTVKQHFDLFSRFKKNK